MKASLDLSARFETSERQRQLASVSDAAPRGHVEAHWPLRDALGLAGLTWLLGLFGWIYAPDNPGAVLAAIGLGLMFMAGWWINERFFCAEHGG